MKKHCYSVILALLLLSSLAQAAAPTSAQQTVITPLRETIHKAKAQVLGDVQKVLAGSLKEQDFKAVSTEEILFALGAGSIEGIEDTGEMLTVGGRGYVKTSDELMGFPVRVAQPKITTPFAIGIKKNPGPGAVFYLKSPEGITLDELYRYLLPRAQGRMGVIIYGRWRSLATTAIKRAPIYHQPIMQEQNRSRYFHSQEFLWDQIALACGLAVTKDSVAQKERPYVERMFYVNFADVRQSGSDVLGHTHILLLGKNRGQPVTEEDLKAYLAGKEPPAPEVRHLLSQSLLYEGIIYLYPLESFHELAPAP